jgi:hypothetical protein
MRLAPYRTEEFITHMLACEDIIVYWTAVLGVSEYYSAGGQHSMKDRALHLSDATIT